MWSDVRPDHHPRQPRLPRPHGAVRHGPEGAVVRDVSWHYAGGEVVITSASLDPVGPLALVETGEILQGHRVIRWLDVGHSARLLQAGALEFPWRLAWRKPSPYFVRCDHPTYAAADYQCAVDTRHASIMGLSVFQ